MFDFNLVVKIYCVTFFQKNWKEIHKNKSNLQKNYIYKNKNEIHNIKNKIHKNRTLGKNLDRPLNNDINFLRELFYIVHLLVIFKNYNIYLILKNILILNFTDIREFL